MQVNTLVRGTSLALIPLSALPANLMPTPTAAELVLQNGIRKLNALIYVHYALHLPYSREAEAMDGFI